MSNNPFMDYQQQFFKTWTENMSKVPGFDAFQKMFPQQPQFPQMPDMQSFWKAFTPVAMPNVTEYWKNFQSMVPGMENYWKSFQSMIPAAPDFSTMFPYKIPGMDMYTKFFDLWKGMTNPVTFAQDFQEKYMDLMQDTFRSVMPENVSNMIAKPMELMDTCVNFYKQSLSPWMQLDEDLIKRIGEGDMSAYTDFFKQFNAKYSETLEKYFNIAGLGLNREANEEQMQAINAYYKMMFSGAELSSLVMNNINDSMKTMFEKFQALIAEGKVPATFREFYDLWYKTTEAGLEKLLDTEEFAEAFGEYLDKYSEYTIAMNKEYERMLSSLPIPTNTDMKSLYKTVYDLRKAVRDLQREVETLKTAKK